MSEQQKIVSAAIAATIGKRGKPSAYRLAQELGVTQSTISQWKHGHSMPSSTHLLALLRRASSGDTVYYVKYKDAANDPQFLLQSTLYG